MSSWQCARGNLGMKIEQLASFSDDYAAGDDYMLLIGRYDEWNIRML